MKKVAYQGWKNCLRLANKSIELIVTGDVGPRVIRFGFIGGANEFYEDPASLGKKGAKKWVFYGGHRLWHAPEVEPRTYAPDNAPVAFEDHGKFTRVVQPVEASTGIRKEIDLSIDAKKPRVRLVHRLANTGPWAVELAPWAISVMAPGGRCIFPLPPRGPHPVNLPPKSLLSMWAYTDMNDPRWTWGRRYIHLRQDAGAREPQKIGAAVHDGWAAYANGGRLFVKRFAWAPGANYPDFGCNFETFTNRAMLEVETLGPTVTLQPGASVEHVEAWSLFDGVAEPFNDEDVEKFVLPRIK
ncbi:MAG: hypothetical protein KIS92_26315 [Planctomycetota bacterium]|nr:hypothetical protein [Planctomycetota bacterium]